MAFLTLKDIGKIYYSGSGAAVGIRGVNLAFDLGEVVAITGKSGSGKSTLLNVISGMDSYEEGELIIEEENTSHFGQAEWETYRKEYISFIFQDYNIIDSFTVLENVELALMNIEDKTERRSRALELIDRVGLLSHLHHKGSRLSGGQKQRTVIARALAKDSPIILADEPTGNLDSKTSKEIIELLCEVSRDKLLIIVTHDFSELEERATRHIRIFDGAVESDREIREAKKFSPTAKKEEAEKSASHKKTLKNGILLGRSIFKAKPKLSVFLSLLMIIGALGIFMLSTMCGGAASLFEPNYMFTPLDGRVIVTKRSGEVISAEEASALVENYGATDALRFDTLLDLAYDSSLYIAGTQDYNDVYVNAQFTFGEDFGECSIGRYPETADEVLLYLPISYKNDVGRDELITDKVFYNEMPFKISGVKYYYDNNVTPKCLFTDEGFRTATALYFLTTSSRPSITVSVSGENFAEYSIQLSSFTPSFNIESDKIYLDSEKFSSIISQAGADYSVSVSLSATYYNYNYYYGDSTPKVFTKNFSRSDITDTKPSVSSIDRNQESFGLILSDELLCEIAESVLDKSYKQISLFFESQREAETAAEKLSENGYIAVSSYTTYEPDPLETIGNTLLSLGVFFAWFIGIVFLAFFLSLCSSRVLGAFNGDMAVMRSMGIPVAVIKVGMYVRMLLSLIPSFIAVGIVAALIFVSPALNGFFVYMYAWQYALIFVGMIILTVRITHKQIKSLFSESVKKSLRGGEAK